MSCISRFWCALLFVLLFRIGVLVPHRFGIYGGGTAPHRNDECARRFGLTKILHTNTLNIRSKLQGATGAHIRYGTEEDDDADDNVNERTNLYKNNNNIANFGIFSILYGCGMCVSYRIYECVCAMYFNRSAMFIHIKIRKRRRRKVARIKSGSHYTHMHLVKKNGKRWKISK